MTDDTIFHKIIRRELESEPNTGLFARGTWCTWTRA